jgi:hypothetical protein
MITAPLPRAEPAWTPSNSPAAMVWSSTGTAKRRTDGSSDGPRGTAQDRSTPSDSMRRSKCRVVASWSWTTKRAMASGAGRSQIGEHAHPPRVDDVDRLDTARRRTVAAADALMRMRTSSTARRTEAARSWTA